MKKTTTVWILVAAVFAVFLLLGILLPGLMGLERAGDRWVLRGGLWLLGAVAALLLWFWRMPPAKRAAAEEGEKGDEIDVILSAARSRLASVQGAQAAKPGRLPVLIVAGPGGSAKSTIVTRSGLEPELLAGEVHSEGAVVPTTAVNVWIAQGNLIVEAGGRLVNEAGRWGRLVRHIRPNRLRAMLPGGRQAPRAMVVCFGCDELLKPGASEAVPALAQKLRARLSETSQQLGIRLPVYVLFTKADRLPYFEDFVRNMTPDEANDVLGVTLTVPPLGAVGGYAERESRRLADAFRSLFRGLALRRLDILPRETKDEVRAGAYEFPREFRKVTDLATRFLLDLCRPSQLGVSPFLRGFYFTGVRPVYIHDVGAVQPQQRSPAPATPMDATAVFDPRQLQQQAQAAPAPAAGSRKVPQWIFHERVFRDVILRDETVRGVTAGGTRVNLLRRVAFATAAAAFLVAAAGFTRSYFANRALLRETRAAVEGARGLASVTPVPDQATMEGLDALRAQSGLLNRYAREGKPLRLGWGLYAGNRIRADVRGLYFQRFGQLLWSHTVRSLADSLGALPATPTQADAYDPTYDALRAYIVMANRPDQSTSPFLEPVLMRFWLAGENVDETRLMLADSQFTFYADELPFGNPYSLAVDEPLVARTQSYLCKFAGNDQFYRMLLNEAGKAGAPVRWSDGTVSNGTVVPAEFTKAGWGQAQAILANVQTLFEKDSWVVGDCAVAPAQSAALEQELRNRYTADYISHWIRFLQTGRIPSPGTIDNASRILASLTTTPSPLFRMLGVVSDNTQVDSTTVDKVFAPVHGLVPPETTAPTDPASQYQAGLINLQGAVNQIATSSGAAQDQARMMATQPLQQLRAQVTAISGTFGTEGQAPVVGAAVRDLMLSPIVGVEAAARALPAQAANAQGASFCGDVVNPVLRKFPFDAGAPTEATIQDVIGVFQPGQGALESFYTSNLQNLLQKVGNRYVASGGSSVNRAFVDFFNRASEVSRALFEDNGNGPQVRFTLRPRTSEEIPEVLVNLEGESWRYTRTQPGGHGFEWRGSAATGASITARIGGTDVRLAQTPPGPWATFRLFHQAARFDSQGSSWLVTWQTPDGSASVTAELSFEKGLPIFRRQYLAGLQCVGRIVR